MPQLQLKDFCKNKLETRVKQKSSFCSLKTYNKTEITPDVTKVSFQVTYNALGHAIFGGLTLGIASYAAESSEKTVYYFDTGSGEYLGHTISEAEVSYNKTCDSYLDSFDLILAEKYASKLYGLRKTTKNQTKYDIIKNMSSIVLNIQLSKFQDAQDILKTTTDDINSLSNKFKTMFNTFKNVIDNCCKFQVNVVNFKKDGAAFFTSLESIFSGYTANIPTAIIDLEELKSTETNTTVISYLTKCVGNLRVSQDGIENLKVGNFEEAKHDFMKIDNNNCFNEFSKYSQLCDIAINIKNAIINENINEIVKQETNLWNQLNECEGILEGNNVFKNILDVCKILNDAPSKEETYDYYLSLINVCQKAMAKNNLQNFQEILYAKLKQIKVNNRHNIITLCENLIENGHQHIKDKNYGTAKMFFKKSQTLVEEYGLDVNNYRELAMCKKYFNAHESWYNAWKLENEAKTCDAYDAFNKARNELNIFQEYFSVITELNDKIDRKIQGNSLINKGLESITFEEGYQLILEGHNTFQQANDELFQQSLQSTEKLLEILQAKSSDKQSALDTIQINIPQIVNHDDYGIDWESTHTRLL